jgi:hypothetical protein
MKLEDRMLLSVRRRSGDVILRSDVAGMGSASQVSEALKALQRRGELVRLGAGVYAKARRDPATGVVVATAEPQTLASQALSKLGVDATLLAEPASSGRALLVADTGPRRISRQLFVGEQPVAYTNDRVKAATHRESAARGPADRELAIRIPSSGVSRYVAELGARHHVTYSRTQGDEWADAVTRLAGDEVESDETGDLLVALRRAHKLTDREMAALLASHLRERKRV